MMRTLSSLAVLLSVSLLAFADGNPNAVSYEKHILPILKAKCYSCHDAKKATASLRLDVRAKAFAGGESKAKGIVAGKSTESELFRRVTTKEQSEFMPPKGVPLTDAETDSLKTWIDEGAKWPDALANEPKEQHWGFVPPKRPSIPTTKTDVGKNPIDAFIVVRLEREGLKPAETASKHTMIRRLFLDLTGLPPKPADLDAFNKDTDPNAFSKLVEKLLASPQYGERWARLWLDAARYADSDGYEKDKPRFVHFYRDWVVNAFNRNLPYDQFLTEQLAGDLLPNATQDQKVATGFLRNSMINEEAGADPEQFRMEAMFDRMDAVGKGMLGLTIQCAQCHTHKFDPLTHTEYYSLFAFLNSAHEVSEVVYSSEELKKRAELLQAMAVEEAELRHKHPNWQDLMQNWIDSVADDQTIWTTYRPDIQPTGSGQKHTLQPDGSIFCEGYAPTKSTEPFSGKLPLKSIAAVRLEVLNDPTLPRGGPGRSVMGLFALSELKVEVNGKPVKIVSATADANALERPLAAQFDDRSNRKRFTGGVELAFDGKDDSAWSIDIGAGRSNVPRQAVFVFEKPIDLPADAKVTVKLTQNHGGWNSDDNQTNNLGRFRIGFTNAPNAKAELIPARIRKLMKKSQQSRTEAEHAAIFSHFRTTVKEWQTVNDKIEALWKDHPIGTTQLTLLEMNTPRVTHLLKRGDFLKPADAVTAGVPKFLNPWPDSAPKNRLGFARWITAQDAPTTGRAFVNRVWQAYFGTGLVGTAEDFGTQAEAPTHPELLDWLAVEFMSPRDTSVTPWDIRHLHRLIVSSRTYQQSSTVDPKVQERDPANKLLARGPRFRADAEVIRDVALSVSGLLSEKLGGPPVYPPIPAFLTLPPASYGPKAWPESTGSERYRRSLYVFKFRSIPYPALQAFDAPTGDFACVKRSRSNTPIQALTGLNEPIFVEAAQVLGRRLWNEGGRSISERIDFAFRLCTSRKATPTEQKILGEFIEKQTVLFSDAKADPWSLAFGRAEDYRLLPHDATPAQLAAWVALARVMLNLDETVTKE